MVAGTTPLVVVVIVVLLCLSLMVLAFAVYFRRTAQLAKEEEPKPVELSKGNIAEAIAKNGAKKYIAVCKEKNSRHVMFDKCPR